MYSYTWDTETGGLLLNTTPLQFSKEPRPVYYRELDLLGFDKYFEYDKNDSAPYMWAESNNYYYKGELVARLKGGSLAEKPELIVSEDVCISNKKLCAVDVKSMVEKNQVLLESLSQDTIKKIYNTFIAYQHKIDVFYVAFSGGKDSIVTLNLVSKSLPHNYFKVVFGDTGMEFPDTYETVSVISQYCKEQGIEFIRAKSIYNPDYTWQKFGPPAHTMRWCCSVHKTSPQIITLRQMVNKSDFTGMAFVGIRASESASRSEYDYISLGEKHKGQYSFNPILEWNSAELFLYLYWQNLYINKAYIKGNRRAGCLVCPMAAERNEWIASVCYPEAFAKLMDKVKSAYAHNFQDKSKLDEFCAKGGWKARKNGRDILVEANYRESNDKDDTVIMIPKQCASWKEWIKTIGILQNSVSPYQILFRNQLYEFEVKQCGEEALEVRYRTALAKENPMFVKLLKNVFKKASSCILCRECEADCHNGCIHMENGDFYISDRCVHCSQCHKPDNGCLVYNSLRITQGGLKMTNSKSLNTYSHHAPKMDWFVQYFSYKEQFDQKHTLGSQMYRFFRAFLRDAGLLDVNGYTRFAELIEKMDLQNESSWALMLSNLAYSTQINWFIKRLKINELYSREYVLSLLVADGAKESWVGDIWASFARLIDLPFSQIGLGTPYKEKDKLVSVTRSSWANPDPKVILYSLFKFAEKCGNYYQFTLSRLLDYSIESDGVSPTEIFGLDRETMEKILNGLSINYPDFISASFTLDLDNITLNSTKTSDAVLELF
jgi:phosphoadenosine phosphosulfate reductase